MKSKTLVLIVDVILVILSMVMIFAFSATDGEKSEAASKEAAREVISVVSHKDTEATEKFIDNHLVIIRKLAHLIEYAILGFLLTNLVKDWNGGLNYKLILLCIGFACIYAGLDEIHQLLINGRNGNLFDVFVDTVGATVGAFIYYAIYKIMIKKKTA